MKKWLFAVAAVARADRRIRNLAARRRRSSGRRSTCLASAPSRERSRTRTRARDAGRLQGVPHAAWRRGVRGRSTDPHAVRHVLLAQHHARHRDRHRQLDRREFLARASTTGAALTARRSIPPSPTRTTRVSRRDANAMFAYLKSLTPVRVLTRDHQLEFPYGEPPAAARVATTLFPARRARPIRKRARNGTAAPISCRRSVIAMPATKRATAGAPVSQNSFSGGRVFGWYAPALDTPLESGLQDWSEADIVALLQGAALRVSGTGKHASTMGPMAEVVFEKPATRCARRTAGDGGLSQVAAEPRRQPRPSPKRHAESWKNWPDSSAAEDLRRSTARVVMAIRAKATHPPRSRSPAIAP